jgi:type I restriction enzyme M protein
MGKKKAARKKSASSSSNGNGANLGFEQKLWLTADKLRNNMDAAEYKHVVLGLIFLKYISDAFEEQHQRLLADADQGADPEDPDEYRAENVFWVPQEARWSFLQGKAKQPTIGKIVDEAMVAIERDNPRLKGVLPKDYARPALDKHRLGELIDLVGTIGLGDAENRSKDILGGVYEYFLGRFAQAEGKSGGQFYTPRKIVKLLVEILRPFHGRVYDPCCGSGGMFVQSERFVEAQDGRIGDISIYGQESNPTTWRLARMNLALRGIDCDLGAEHADTFRRDLHKDLKADFVLANPPFNDSDWVRHDDDVRWKYGVPPKGNANFAWVQHFIAHLSPRGRAGFVLANSALSVAGQQGDIRLRLAEDDLVECIVSLAPKLFYNFQGPVSLWFLTRNKSAHSGFRNRKGQMLFIDARKLACEAAPGRNDLGDDHIEKISSTYGNWATGKGYQDEIGFCASVNLEQIHLCNNSLVPGRHVGIPVAPPDRKTTSRHLSVAVTGVRETLRRIEKLANDVQQALENAHG